jgi:hypothetical protein
MQVLYLFQQVFSSDSEINISPAVSQTPPATSASSLTAARKLKMDHWREAVTCHITTPDRGTGNLSDTEITAKDSAKKRKRKFIKQVYFCIVEFAFTRPPRICLNCRRSLDLCTVWNRFLLFWITMGWI